MNNLTKAIVYKILAFVGLITPMLILIIYKRDEYFNGNVLKVSAGCILALVFTLFCVLGKIKSLNGIFTLSIIWFLSYLLKVFVDDILIIIPLCMLGTLFYNIFDHFYKHYYDIHIVRRNAGIEQEARNEVNETFNEELTNEEGNV